MNLRKAVLKSFNSGDYTATIQLAGSYKTYLEGVAVARSAGGRDGSGEEGGSHIL
jgi:hypothetical protein